MPAIPRLPTVIAIRPPASTRAARWLVRIAWATSAGDVGDLGLVEVAADAGDRWEVHRVVCQSRVQRVGGSTVDRS